MLSLTLPAQVENLPMVFTFILNEARRRGIDIYCEPRLELVVEELFVNICRYAYPSSAHGTVDFLILPPQPERPSCLQILIRDTGAAFNPLENTAPDIATPLQDRRRGGLGIHLVRNLTSALSYRRNDGTNELFLEFHMQAEG